MLANQLQFGHITIPRSAEMGSLSSTVAVTGKVSPLIASVTEPHEVRRQHLQRNTLAREISSPLSPWCKWCRNITVQHLCDMFEACSLEIKWCSCKSIIYWHFQGIPVAALFERRTSPQLPPPPPPPDQKSVVLL